MVGIFYSFEVKRLEKSKTEELFVPPQETAAERSKIRKTKTDSMNQNLNSKQTINQTSSIISSNKS